MTVEDFGNADNLMIDWAVAEHGGISDRQARRRRCRKSIAI